MQFTPPAPPRNRLLLAAACLFLPVAAARADQPALRELLRDGLYAEEVTRDPEAAAKQYEQVLARYSEQRSFAAAALFRLAEVRRKQDRKEDAVKLYQQLLADFPGAATETKLARENLAALGGKPLEAQAIPGPPVPFDAEAQELARLKAAATAAPDVLLDPKVLENAALQGWMQVVKFLLAVGNPRYDGRALELAAQTGNLEIIKLLLADGGPVPEAVASNSLLWAIKSKRYTVLDFLLKSGLKPGLVDGAYGSLPVLAQTVLVDAAYSVAEILLKNGADIDEMIVRPVPQGEEVRNGTALALAVYYGKFDAVKWLLEKGAKPDLPDPTYGLTPLHYAALAQYPGTLETMEKLLAAGADPNRVSADQEVKEGFPRFISNNATPLESAIGSGSMALEKTKLLLKHGAMLDRKNSRVSAMLVAAIKAGNPNLLEIVPLLLKQGANPNAIGEKDRLLREAVKIGNVELLKMLLDYGADPNPPAFESKSLLESVADLARDDFTGAPLGIEAYHPDRIWPVIELLLDRGSKVAPEWENENFKDCHEGIRARLIRRISYPKWAKEKVVWICRIKPKLSSFWKIRLAAQDGEQASPALGRLLLDQEKGPLRNLEKDFTILVLIRISNEKLTEQVINLMGDDPYPKLEWGDILEIRDMSSGSTSSSTYLPWPPETRNALERSVNPSSERAHE